MRASASSIEASGFGLRAAGEAAVAVVAEVIIGVTHRWAFALVLVLVLILISFVPVTGEPR